MRRNRPFRPRQPGRRLRRSVIRRPALQRLKFAHKLLEKEEFAQAGAAFEELGVAALRRRIPRAPQLFLQAGRAYAKAGHAQKGTELLVKGLRTMAKMGQVNRLPIVSRRILNGLRELGMTSEHQILEGEINQLLSMMDLSLQSEDKIPTTAKLPPKCPYCGGTVHPDEVDWINESAATCVFCGSVVEGTT